MDSMNQNQKRSLPIVFLSLLVISLLFSACVRPIASPDVLNSTPITYVPVTLEPPTPVFTPTVATPTLSPMVNSANCTNVLSFVDDVTVPDGTSFKAGETIEKKWKVRNDGSCNWIDGYTLVNFEGDPLGSEKTLPLVGYPAEKEGVITIEFIAPETPGHYHSGWIAANPNGSYFGDAFYIQIVVE